MRLPVFEVDQRAALDRLAEKVSGLPEEDRAPYLFLCLAILGGNALEVMHACLAEQADVAKIRLLEVVRCP